MPAIGKKPILVVFPTRWDRKQLDVCRSVWEDRYEILFAEPMDEECPWDLDLLGYIDRLVAEHRGRIAGVFSSSDYPGATVAAAIASRLGLPGTPPDRILQASHKYYSRLAQQEIVPEAVPEFALLDPARPAAASVPFGFPCFVKPVKGAFSVLARRVESATDLRAFLSQPQVAEFTGQYLHLFHRLVSDLTDLDLDGRYFVAEALLQGVQVTVEGVALGEGAEILGVVDSVLHPETGSFVRFDYPSTLPREVQERMGEIARRLTSSLGLRNTLFNLEMIYDPASDRISIVELNPRMCTQFADLYQKVDGVNGYQVALAAAAGDPLPKPSSQGRYRVASSIPLRVFQPVRVIQAPGAEEIQAAEALYPDTLIWSECETGQELTDFLSCEDGRSARYAVLNLGADSRKELLHRARQVEARLGFGFEAV